MGVSENYRGITASCEKNLYVKHQPSRFDISKLAGTFRKLGVPYFGVHIIRILLFRVL